MKDGRACRGQPADLSHFPTHGTRHNLACRKRTAEGGRNGPVDREEPLILRTASKRLGTCRVVEKCDKFPSLHGLPSPAHTPGDLRPACLRLEPHRLMFEFPISRRLLSTVTVDCFWRPIASPSRKSVFGCLALKICGRLDELRPVYAIKCVYVEHGISNTVDCGCYDWYCAARLTNMKICSLCSEPVARHARVVGDLHAKPAIWMRGPGRSVLCT